LLWGLLAFAAFQGGLAVAIECWLPELRDPDYAYKAALLRGRAGRGPDRPLTVVMVGSSRTAFALQGARLEAEPSRHLGRSVVVFNFGIFGAGPVMELLTLKRLLAEGVKPDLLLVEVLPPLLAGQYPDPLEAHHLTADRLWLRDLAVLEPYGYAVARLRQEWWQSWPVPWYSHRFTIVSRFLPALLPIEVRSDFGRGADGSGWVLPPITDLTPAQRRRAEETALRDYAGYFAGYRLGGHQARALRDTLEMCRREGITAALVLMPEGTAFQGLYPPGSQDQLNAFLAGLCRDFAAPVVDARGWSADEDFSDGHHLLPHGAARFSDRLGREVVLPLLAQVHARREQKPQHAAAR
jgi:hypothetical protein